MSIGGVGIGLRWLGQGPKARGGLLFTLIEHWFPRFFSPRGAVAALDDRRFEWPLETAGTWEGQPLWAGEGPLPALSLTRLGGGAALPSDWLQREGIEATAELHAHFVGALEHRPPIPGAPAGWYARQILSQGAAGAVLAPLARVKVDATADSGSVRVVLCFDGYPLSHVSPQLSSKGRLQPAPLAETVDDNRLAFEQHLRALARLLAPGVANPFWEVGAHEVFYEHDRAWFHALGERLNAETGDRQ